MPLVLAFSTAGGHSSIQEDYLGHTSRSYSADFVYTETTDDDDMQRGAVLHVCTLHSSSQSTNISVCRLDG